MSVKKKEVKLKDGEFVLKREEIVYKRLGGGIGFLGGVICAIFFVLAIINIIFNFNWQALGTYILIVIIFGKITQWGFEEKGRRTVPTEDENLRVYLTPKFFNKRRGNP